MQATLSRTGLVAVYGTVAAAAALAWVATAAVMSGMPAMPTDMAAVQAWSTARFAAGAATWTLMMAAMMLPAAAPMTATFPGLSRRRLDPVHASWWTALFVTGYLATWMVFSVAAALAQQLLTAAGALAGGTLMRPLGGAALIGAGVYQLSPLKHACLRRCRTPVGFLAAHWRDGPAGSARMGARHGLWCLGCCVPLMLVLCAVGVMSLVWMAALTLLVLGEKTLPFAQVLAGVGGLTLIALGGWMLASLSGAVLSRSLPGGWRAHTSRRATARRYAPAAGRATGRAGDQPTAPATSRCRGRSTAAARTR